MRFVIPLLLIALLAAVLGFGGIAHFSLELIIFGLIAALIIGFASMIYRSASAT